MRTSEERSRATTQSLRDFYPKPNRRAQAKTVQTFVQRGDLHEKLHTGR